MVHLAEVWHVIVEANPPHWNITRAELARRLNWKRESVDRLFRLNHVTRLEQFVAAFRALGHRVEISVH
jgi:antitoxin HicB